MTMLRLSLPVRRPPEGLRRVVAGANQARLALVLAQRHIATWTQMLAMAGIGGTLAALGLMLARELVTRLK